jgi:sugar phosphate isomerase/epimerase
MKIGLGTYTYFWQISSRRGDDGFLETMLDEAAQLGGQVFQVCDYPPLNDFSASRLSQVRRHAESLGLELEVGTRGVDADHLERYLGIAEALGARFVRSMFARAGEDVVLASASRELKKALVAYRASGVTLGLETYEQVSAADTVRVIDELGTDCFGVCLDPANGIGSYELPQDTVATTAPYVVNVHVKDFDFARREGGQGFTVTGRALGEGAYDLSGILAALATHGRDPNLILEHWVPYDTDDDSTIARERAWTRHGMTTLLSQRED